MFAIIEGDSDNYEDDAPKSIEDEEVSSKLIVSDICSNQVSSNIDNQDASQDSSESVNPNAIYDIIQAVQKETQLSNDMSKVAVETMLISLRDLIPGLAARSVIDALLHEANSTDSNSTDIKCPKNTIDVAPDALRMMTALSTLYKAASDALEVPHDDDDGHDLQAHLRELISVMSNADLKIAQTVLSSNEYFFVTTLAECYQMERRWPLRQLLLQAYGVMCDLERTAIATLAQSALPAEIARDMRDNPCDVSRLSHCALLLSMILSMGDKLPITHFEHIGVDFAIFLLDLIENPPETDVKDQIPDLFLTLVLAYNLQFEESLDNFLLNALATRDNAKTFCEKILWLLNREENPVHFFGYEPAPAHSVIKMLVDVFSRKKTAELFHINDVKIIIDDIMRQLHDLLPGDTRRQQYLRIFQGIFRNTNYGALDYYRRAELVDACRSKIDNAVI